MTAHIAEQLRHLAIPITSLVLDPSNARKHGDRNLEAIKASLAKFGQRSPVVVQRDGMVVRSGNGRLLAAKALGWTEIAATIIDEDNSTAAQFAIADNRTAELAEWDNETLALLLDGWDKETRESVGFDEADLKAVMADLEPEEIVEDEVPEPPADPVTKAGDLWVLGEHRLLCGDSTKAEDVERVMNGERAEMMHADPPYGVSYDGGHFHSGDVNVKRTREKLAADDSTDIYGKFLPEAMKVVDGPCYLWFAGSLGRAVYSAVEDAGGVISTLLIWHKTNATYAAMNAQYKQRHEPCLYFKPKKSTLRWVGPADACSLWEFKKEGLNKLHPTQKPVQLVANALRNHKAELVYDPFLGSGTTLIAAEQLGRKCYGMEISPAYCDVIVKRWETLTGKKAVLANG